MDNTNGRPEHCQSSWFSPIAWVMHEDKITTLYETTTLADVMAIMLRDHGLKATPKMYKDRLRKWGAKKYLKEGDAVRMARLKARRDRERKKTEHFVSGAAKFDVVRVARDVAKTRKFHFDGEEEDLEQAQSRTLQTNTASTPTPQWIRSPKRLHNIESTLAKATICLDSSVENGRWSVDQGTNTLLGGITNNYCAFIRDMSTGILFLLPEEYTMSFKHLNLAFARVRGLLLEESPLLAATILLPISFAIEELGEQKGILLGRMLIEFVRNMAGHLLSAHHPSLVFWNSVVETVDSPEIKDQYESIGSLVVDWLNQRYAICSPPILEAYNLLSWAVQDPTNARHSAERQLRLAIEQLESLPRDQRRDTHNYLQGELRCKLARLLADMDMLEAAVAEMGQFWEDHHAGLVSNDSIGEANQVSFYIDQCGGRYQEACLTLRRIISERCGNDLSYKVFLLQQLGLTLKMIGDEEGAAAAFSQGDRLLQTLEEAEGIPQMEIMLKELRLEAS